MLNELVHTKNNVYRRKIAVVIGLIVLVLAIPGILFTPCGTHVGVCSIALDTLITSRVYLIVAAPIVLMLAIFLLAEHKLEKARVQHFVLAYALAIVLINYLAIVLFHYRGNCGRFGCSSAITDEIRQIVEITHHGHVHIP